MSSDRDHLQALVDARPEEELPVAISFRAKLADEEIINLRRGEAD